MKNTLHKAARCLLFTILATATPLARSVVYVDGAAAGLENGTSWANAYKDLRIAMAASPANAEIWVAAGVYKPGPSRADSFALKTGMKLYGGFTSGMTARDQRDWAANPTTLSGDINALNNHTDNSNHVLTGAPDAVVDGFTVERGGDTTYSTADGVASAFGGGLFVTDIESAAMKLANCTFRYNNAFYDDETTRANTGHGGAIAAEGTVNAVNCVFAGNYSGSEDSRELLSFTTLSPETFSTNIVDNGNGTMTTNLVGNGDAVIQTNVVVACGIKGGGAAFWQKPGSNGGSTLENCTFAGNRANKYGGAVFADNLTNDVELLNCIAWGDEAWRRFRDELDTADELFGDSIVVRYTDIAGGWSGTGGNNLDVDPRFGVNGTGDAFTGTWTTAPTWDPAKGQTTFTDVNASWIPGELVGRFLEPTTNEWIVFAPKNWGAPDYTNSVCGLKFPIAANTATTVSVYGDPRNVDYYWRTTRTYAASGHFYRIFDYHLKAMGGRWTPLTPVTGRWTVDDVDSPCLHQGDPASDYALEPYPNGSQHQSGRLRQHGAGVEARRRVHDAAAVAL